MADILDSSNSHCGTVSAENGAYLARANGQAGSVSFASLREARGFVLRKGDPKPWGPATLLHVPVKPVRIRYVASFPGKPDKVIHGLDDHTARKQAAYWFGVWECSDRLILRRA